MRNIAIGRCDGTAAAIKVCLGWIPDYVKIWNMEDADNKEPVLEWVRPMAGVAQMDEGIKTTGISDSDLDRTVMAANGVAVYTGGDVIVYDGKNNNRWETPGADGQPSGTSAEEIYLDGTYRKSEASDPEYRCYGDAVMGSSPGDGNRVTTVPGFVIGADTDVNVDGEALCWLAARG
jgi:hypothetical protein